MIEAQEEGHAAARYIRVCPLKRHAGSELLQRKIEYYSTGVIARIDGCWTVIHLARKLLYLLLYSLSANCYGRYISHEIYG
ncbi:MAG: hypothetical protein WAN75_16460, partial [Xanthobacteraceae bacterium]